MLGTSTSYARLTTGDSTPLQRVDVNSKRDALRNATSVPSGTANVEAPLRRSASTPFSWCNTRCSVPLRA